MEPSLPSGDAPCPRCGTLLWFIKTKDGLHYHEAERIVPIKQKIMDAIRRTCLGVAQKEILYSTFIKNIGADSLDIVELIMELEEEFEVTIPDEEAEQIKTVGELIDCIARQLPSDPKA
jgi:acyl carrier protein